MGFPVGCSELVLPRVLVWLIFLLSALRRAITWCLASAGLGDLLDADAFILAGAAAGATSGSSQPLAPYYNYHQHEGPRPLSASLVLRKIPSAPYERRHVIEGEGDGCHSDLESCAVCLYEFEGGEEVRQLEMCRHVFHRCCIDPWIQIGSRTCPLCRSQIVSEEDGEAADADDTTAATSSHASYYQFDDYHDLVDAYFGGGDEGDYTGLFPPLLPDDPSEARALEFISWPLPEATHA